MALSYETSKIPDTTPANDAALFWLQTRLARILTEANHTHDESNRGFDFISPVQPLGSRALEQTLMPMTTVDQQDEPHEHFGFGD